MDEKSKAGLAILVSEKIHLKKKYTKETEEDTI